MSDCPSRNLSLHLSLTTFLNANLQAHLLDQLVRPGFGFTSTNRVSLHVSRYCRVVCRGRWPPGPADSRLRLLQLLYPSAVRNLLSAAICPAAIPRLSGDG